MTDRTSGPGDEREAPRAGRIPQPLPDEDWTPEDAPLHHHTPRDLPEAPGEGRMSGERGAGHDSPMPDDWLGVPSSGEMAGREAHTTDYPAPDAWPAAPGGRATTPGPATAPEPAAGTGGAAGRAGGPGPEGDRAGVPAAAPGGSAAASSGAVGEAAPGPSGVGAPLLPHEETDRWEQEMRRLAAGFVDEPRTAVEQADHVLEEIAGRFEEAVERRRRTLRRSWEASEDRGPGSDADTEQLRLALRDYRELAGRLLHM